MSNSSRSSVVNLETNWVPLSDTISSGRLWCLKICRRYNWAVISDVASVVVGEKWAIFVSRSTQTYIALYSSDRGSSTMKSMDTEDHGAGGIDSGWSFLWGFWRGHLFREHVSQVSIYSLMNWRMRGQ